MSEDVIERRCAVETVVGQVKLGASLGEIGAELVLLAS